MESVYTDVVEPQWDLFVLYLIKGIVDFRDKPVAASEHPRSGDSVPTGGFGLIIHNLRRNDLDGLFLGKVSLLLKLLQGKMGGEKRCTCTCGSLLGYGCIVVCVRCEGASRFIVIILRLWTDLDPK